MYFLKECKYLKPYNNKTLKKTYFEAKNSIYKKSEKV